MASEIFLWATSLLCVVAVVVLQFRMFGSRFKTRSPDDILSFFLLSEVSNRQQRLALFSISALPITILFATILVYNHQFGYALSSKFVNYLYNTYLVEIVSGYASDEQQEKTEIVTDLVGDDMGTSEDLPSAEEQIKKFLNNISIPLGPLAILLIGLILFSNYLEFVRYKLERLVMILFGIPGIENRLVKKISKIIITELSYDSAKKILVPLNDNYPLPLPEELMKRSEEEILSFQLIHVSKSQAATLGLRKALQLTIERAFAPSHLAVCKKIAPHLDQYRRINESVIHIAGGVVIYIMACGAGLALIPILPELFSFLEKRLPSYENSVETAIDFATMSVAALLPTILGLAYLEQESSHDEASLVRTRCVVVAMVFIWALAVRGAYTVFAYVEYRERWAEAEFIYILSYSLVPAVAVLILSWRRILKSPFMGWRGTVMPALALGGGSVLAHVTFDAAGKQNYDWIYYSQLLVSVTVLGTVGFLVAKGLREEKLKSPGSLIALPGVVRLRR